ncbi:MAG: DNA polymerase III subunit delta [Clostridia bacterium]|nr:DNA polymerase III subunit delta [Clostridia bacterium]
MKFVEFSKSLKSKIENVYNAKGDDLFLLRQAVLNLKSAVIKDLEEFNYIKLDAEKLKPDEVVSHLMTLPIGNDYRLVVLEKPNQDIVKILNTFDFSDNQLIVLCLNADKLTVGEVIDCSKLDREDITKYILNYFAKNGVSVQEQALDYIIDACDMNMAKIVNELAKLSAYAHDTKVVDITTATNLIADTTEYVIFMLTNAIDSKDYTKYQKVLHEMSKSQSMNEIFAYMGKYFRRMQYIALSKDDLELSTILNLKPYAIKMSRQAIAKNGIKYYLSLYQKYVELDYKIKSGNITASNALYELVF